MHHLRKFGILLFLFAAVSPLSAQWKLAASNAITPIFRPYNGGGVIMSHNGVLWAGYKDIWMSADTGKSWSLRTPFNGFNNSCIKDISFFNDNIGLATTQNGEIYTTQDKGISWVQHVPPNPYFSSIESGCFAGSALNIIACTYAGDRYVSDDGGLTWIMSKIDSFATQVLSGSGGTAYLISGVAGKSKLWITHDGGKFWTTLLGEFNWDSYSFARDQCDTSTFFVVNDDFVEKTDKFSRVYITNNVGATWQESGQLLRPNHCGSISAAQNAIFVQTFSGISRSTDQGQTWKDIGGPPNIVDTRFVTALDNNVVVAVDDQGSVWVTNNSGGDSLATTDGGKVLLQTADQKSDTIGGSVAVPISLKGIASPVDLELTVHYDKQLLYKGTYSIGGTRLDLAGESWQGRSKILIQNANSSGILANSYFDVFNDSSKKTSVVFDSIIFCINYLPTSATSTITPASGCSADILTRFLRDSTMPELRIIPNPSSNGDIFISSNANLGDVNISFINMLGNSCSSFVQSLRNDQLTKLSTHLPNGIYSVRITSRTRNYDLHVVILR